MYPALCLRPSIIDVSDALSRLAFAGKDASRALAKSSVKPEDCRPDWEDLDEKEKKTLDQWVTFFTKRYNIVGKVVGG